MKEKSKIIHLLTSFLVFYRCSHVFFGFAKVKDIGYFIQVDIGFYLAIISSIGIMVISLLKIYTAKASSVK
jgi:hypothetical protein